MKVLIWFGFQYSLKIIMPEKKVEKYSHLKHSSSRLSSYFEYQVWFVPRSLWWLVQWNPRSLLVESFMQNSVSPYMNEFFVFCTPLVKLRRKFITIVDNIYSGSVETLYWSLQKRKKRKKTEEKQRPNPKTEFLSLKNPHYLFVLYTNTVSLCSPKVIPIYHSKKLPLSYCIQILPLLRRDKI